jgi:hypothetical protein
VSSVAGSIFAKPVLLEQDPVITAQADALCGWPTRPPQFACARSFSPPNSLRER